jgi:hypothetical protein
MLKYALSLALLFVSVHAQAQPKGGRPDPGAHGRGGPRLVTAAGGVADELVKGAPYSADIITESTQTLPDGNRIRHSATTRLYRDGEGRVRREQSLRSLAASGADADSPRVIFINDPVAGVSYALNPKDRAATKSGLVAPPHGRGSGRPPAGAPRGKGAPKGDRPQPPDANAKTESLGRRAIEGLQADGTRTTTTIPPGQIGNEQPIHIVSETWYSPEIRTVVLTKRSDPRFGETVTRLANVSRAEPPASLFAVPADFKVSEAPRNMRIPGGAGKR